MHYAAILIQTTALTSPAPLLPTKAYTMPVPIFKKKGVFFQWEARIREIEKKG